MKRSTSIILGTGLVAASMALGGCSESDPEYDQICVDQETMIRSEDKECEPEHGSHHWFYVPFVHNGTIPAHPVGSKVTTSGSFVRPATGTFSRGGFGGYRGVGVGGGG